ncbi:TPA: hypothetical protein U2Q33_001432 [Citrobacter farmeri]|nr:hypothetical protein [Citrobacter farmeri]HEM8561650.1 hypothetical protein [Citrobacter farmeri]
MMEKVYFNTPESLPTEEVREQQFLLVNHDNDYLVATAFFDESSGFICFMSHVGPIHPHEYKKWALLPTVKD